MNIVGAGKMSLIRTMQSLPVKTSQGLGMSLGPSPPFSCTRCSGQQPPRSASGSCSSSYVDVVLDGVVDVEAPLKGCEEALARLPEDRLKQFSFSNGDENKAVLGQNERTDA
ncbi:hypothetical protein TraAM80_01012 [Trypanosoma rangeli]|uniref:Uncharacterized protein n=1 Tax=Trypanosoma rangeli TaxID=5698 RepID=A0A3S5ISI1_TRYRA|nr:uncharacterized protein TraAM80_01012 [Trypanosoma rangeli]RNF11395.1 hypothetical protein TraAM80_01012 [Trypanosoma rangeli]|eukprot:RNF11395.1 hypothetical protein TraAM80_01012 [Trypanosoma rangeli]